MKLEILALIWWWCGGERNLAPWGRSNSSNKGGISGGIIINKSGEANPQQDVLISQLVPTSAKLVRPRVYRHK